LFRGKTYMMKTINLSVTGMHCSGCALAVQDALEKVKGVIAVTVDHNKRTAVVSYDQELPETGELLKAIREAGYSGGLSS